MKAKTEKTVSKQSKAVAGASSVRQVRRKSDLQFEDSRPAVVAQRELAGKADSSPQAGRIAQLQAIVDGSAAATVQRQGLEEEEPLQGKFETIQKQEEEELLQGRFETVQRQGAGEEEEMLQGKFEPVQTQGLGEDEIQAKSAVVQQKEQKPANNTGLPDTLKSGIENLSGLSLDDVKVHYNSAKPAQLQAHAFAQGNDIHMAPGQEEHLPHEAWHTVQQREGRVKPTMDVGGMKINDDAGLEKEADVMGNKAARLSSTSFSANELVPPVQLENENTAQPISIQLQPKKTVQQEKVAKLHVHADLDAPGMALINQLRSGNVGHAWISLEWKDSTKVPDDIPDNHKAFLGSGGSQADPMGFWPRMFKEYDDALDQWRELPDDQRAGYSSNPFSSYVPGQMLHPDNIHSPKATQSYDVTHEQAKDVINYAESKRGAQYSVFFYNCTTFAKEAAEAGGQTPPKMGTLGICYPDKLYKSILKNQQKEKGTTTIYTDKGATTVEGEGNERKKG